MALLELSKLTSNIRRVVGAISLRTQYSGETLQLLQPFRENTPVDGAWADRFEMYLLQKGRQDLVEAAAHSLSPHNRASLIATLAETLGESDFRPRERGRSDIISEIWAKSRDKKSLTTAITEMNLPDGPRSRILASFK